MKNPHNGSYGPLIDDPDSAIAKPFVFEKTPELSKKPKKNERWGCWIKFKIDFPDDSRADFSEQPPDNSESSTRDIFEPLLERSGPALLPVLCCIFLVGLLVRTTATKSILAVYEAA